MVALASGGWAPFDALSSRTGQPECWGIAYSDEVLVDGNYFSNLIPIVFDIPLMAHHFLLGCIAISLA